jgi:hemolysin III
VVKFIKIVKMNDVIKKEKYSPEFLKGLFKYSLGEDIANAVTHVVGCIFSIYAIVSLSYISAVYGHALDIVAYVLYGVSILFMFLMSTLYHSMVNPTARIVFKRLDHIAIFVLISGSYMPYVFSLLKTTHAYVIYGIVLFFAGIGIIFKSVYAGKFKKTSTLIYIAMGWCSLYLLPQIWHQLAKPGMWLLIASGITYTFGGILYGFTKFKYSHMVWHILVLGGAVCMFVSINFFILQYR